MNRIKELRLAKGLKQSELAEIAKVGQTTISNWEREDTEIDKQSLFRLTDFFKVTTDYLLGKSDFSVYDIPLNIPESLQGAKVGFHRSEFEELTQDEVDTLALIADKLKSARKNAGK